MITYPPGPKSRFPGSLLIAFQRDRAGFLLKLAREYGEIAHFAAGNEHFYLLSDPEAIKDVLVTNERKFVKSRGLQVIKPLLGEGLLTSEGEFHLRQRRLLQPVFHRSRIAQYASTMVEHAMRVSDSWRDGETLDMAREMMRLTLLVVAKTLFDADVDKDARDVGEALAAVRDWFPLLLLPFARHIEKLPLPANRRARSALKKLDEIIYKMIEERKSKKDEKHDLLSMLLQARDEDGAGMPDKQVRDEAMTIFLAGHETTANGLTFAWYLLSQNPEAEARLLQEVDAVLGERPPTVEDVDRLEYTEKVFTEALRLYPPAWIVARKAAEEYAVNGYTIPKGSTVFLSPFVVQRDARYFPEPDAFIPERWSPEFKKKVPRFAYFPFGGGSRLCIGEPFAWMEGVLLLATQAARWQMRYASNEPPRLDPSITLRPRGGLMMHLKARKAGGLSRS